MALPAEPFRISIAFALAAAGVTATNAQSLNQPNPLDRLSDVVQSDVPRDIKFVFYGGGGCLERSTKHLHVPPPPPPAAQESVIPAPQFIQLSEELLHARVSVRKKSLKEERKKSAIQYECKPVSKPR